MNTDFGLYFLSTGVCTAPIHPFIEGPAPCRPTGHNAVIIPGNTGLQRTLQSTSVYLTIEFRAAPPPVSAGRDAPPRRRRPPGSISARIRLTNFGLLIHISKHILSPLLFPHIAVTFHAAAPPAPPPENMPDISLLPLLAGPKICYNRAI